MESNPVTYCGLYYRAADGRLDLFARDYPAGNGGEEQTPLLLMHGLTRNSADFEPMIERLGTKRRLIVPDQRGRGLSQYDTDPGNYRTDVYAADMWMLLQSLGIDRVVCIGTSMGGLIAMVMGAMAPERINGIVLNDVGPEVSEEGLDRIRGYVGSSEQMAGWDEAADQCRAANAFAMADFSQEDWIAFARRTCEKMPGGEVRFAYDPAIAVGLNQQDPATVPTDPWALWEAISNIPVLVLRGAISDILAPETVVEMAQRHSREFSSVAVAGRGHAPILDEPVSVEAIRSFLERQS